MLITFESFWRSKELYGSVTELLSETEETDLMNLVLDFVSRNCAPFTKTRKLLELQRKSRLRIEFKPFAILCVWVSLWNGFGDLCRCRARSTGRNESKERLEKFNEQFVKLCDLLDHFGYRLDGRDIDKSTVTFCRLRSSDRLIVAVHIK